MNDIQTVASDFERAVLSLDRAGAARVLDGLQGLTPLDLIQHTVVPALEDHNVLGKRII